MSDVVRPDDSADRVACFLAWLSAFTRYFRLTVLVVLPVILGLLAYRVENYWQGTFMLALGLVTFWWTGRIKGLCA